MAKLQQRIWTACCTLTLPHDPDTEIVYSQHDWYVTCVDILTPRSIGSSRNAKDGISKMPSRDSKEESSTCTQLWSSVFRAPFMVKKTFFDSLPTAREYVPCNCVQSNTLFQVQVERLLQQSCHSVMIRAKMQLLEALSAEGLVVDPITLAVSVAVPASYSKKGMCYPYGLHRWFPSHPSSV